MGQRFAASIVLLIAGGCVNTSQLISDTESHDLSLDPITFHQQGIGFLTPISATGQEAGRASCRSSTRAPCEPPGCLRAARCRRRPLAEARMRFRCGRSGTTT